MGSVSVDGERLHGEEAVQVRLYPEERRTSYRIRRPAVKLSAIMFMRLNAWQEMRNFPEDTLADNEISDSALACISSSEPGKVKACFASWQIILNWLTFGQSKLPRVRAI